MAERFLPRVQFATGIRLSYLIQASRVEQIVCCMWRMCPGKLHVLLRLPVAANEKRRIIR